METYNIETIRRVLEFAKVECQKENITPELKSMLSKAVTWSESQLKTYLSTSTQKQLFIPEFSMPHVLPPWWRHTNKHHHQQVQQLLAAAPATQEIAIKKAADLWIEEMEGLLRQIDAVSQVRGCMRQIQVCVVGAQLPFIFSPSFKKG
ncbi:MAG: hypothetical protein Q9168_003565, partial [Polycauliona sp. 1 TL-2023]